MSWLAVQREATEGQRDYTMAERLFCLAIGSRMGDKAEAWPSLRSIARFAGSSVSTMVLASKRPCDAEGIFVRSLRPGRSGSCAYRVRPEIVAKWATEDHAEDRHSKPVTMPESGINHADPANRMIQEQPISSAGNHAGIRHGKGGGAEPWLIQARGAWSESVGDAPRWFADDLRRLVAGSRTGADVLEGLRLYLQSADLQKPGAELLRAFCQNAARWCSQAKPKAPTKPRQETPEERRARALRYNVVLPA